MLSFLNRYRKNLKYSQNGEEGILREALRRFKLETGRAVEFGANDGYYCSNTALLLENGWSGRLIEGDVGLFVKCKENWKNYPKVEAVWTYIDEINVNFFVNYETDVLSIDTDGPDYTIFEGLRARPKIVVIEIDSSISPFELEQKFNSDGAAGYRAMLELALEKNYFLLVHTGNLVLVANEYRSLFPEIVGDGISNAGEYFNRSWLK